MKTLADLINAMDFRESLELAKAICDSRLADILSDREHIRQVVRVEAGLPPRETVKAVVPITRGYDKGSVQTLLLQLGIKPCNKGYKYLLDCVTVLTTDPTYLEKITALYVKIGRMNNSNGSRVERAIRHSLTDLSGDILYNVIPTFNEHCTNKEFITYLMMYLEEN